MSYDVAGKTIFVTGAARGIGAECARRLHARGANVALVGLEPQRLAALADELGERACWFEADVVDAAALQAAVEGTVERFGGIDVAIANAGIQMNGAVATAPPEQFDRVLEVNLMGVLRTVRAVMPQITARKGYLINVASLAAVAHAPLMGAYAASKAAVEALTDSLRVETAHTGARVGCAYFGFIDTDLVRASFDQPSSRTMQGLMPGFIRRSVPVGDAADAIVAGIAGRRKRVWAPRYVGLMLLVRGLVQPISELRALRDRRIADAVKLTDPAAGSAEIARADLLLGVAAHALEEPAPASAA